MAVAQSATWAHDGRALPKRDGKGVVNRGKKATYYSIRRRCFPSYR
jgi:hypothetical protein